MENRIFFEEEEKKSLMLIRHSKLQRKPVIAIVPFP